MENYKIQERLGDGTYGCVYKATQSKTGEVVAIKKFKKKYSSWDDCMQLREIKALRKLTHPNIIKLKEVLKEQDELNLVFEYLERNVFEAYMEYKNKGQKISESTIKSIMRQLVEGLAYMHKHGYFHRDLKPENLLMFGDTVKICDFGLAREIRSRPPYTDYVATRWYRAPEILLKQTNYNSPVDIFAVGCIMAELYMLSPLFSGQSEMDQLHKICQIMGTPNNQNWPEAQKLANQAGISFPQYQPQSLENIIPNASSEAIFVIQQMLLYDPSQRPSAQQILSFPYFTSHNLVTPIQTQFPKPVKAKEEERFNFGKLGEAQLTKNNFYDVLDVKKKKDDKFRDSSTNFLDFLDQKLIEQDKQWNAKAEKNKQATREKFNPKPTLHHQNSKDNVEDVTEFLQQQDDASNKRNNPFKLLKYNDPIGVIGSNSVNHNYNDPLPAKQQKPLSMIHTNQYQQAQYSIPYMNGKSTILPKAELSPSLLGQRMPQQLGQPKIPMYYQSRIHQNYGRLGENLVGGGRRNISTNNKYDDFGFNKPSKQYNY